jgi:hypothetical protein
MRMSGVRPGWLALGVAFSLSWFSLFAIFTSTTASAVAKVHFNYTVPDQPSTLGGRQLGGVLFATYNGLGARCALIIPWFVARVTACARAPGQLGGSARRLLRCCWIRNCRMVACLDARARMRLGDRSVRWPYRHAGQQHSVEEDGRQPRLSSTSSSSSRSCSAVSLLAWLLDVFRHGDSFLRVRRRPGLAAGGTGGAARAATTASTGFAR